MTDFINADDINDVILAAAANELEQMVDKMCELIGTPLEQTTELERQIMAALVLVRCMASLIGISWRSRRPMP
ncbi:hypothetical protein MKY92_21545 [Paenibacillus sp. FSL R5-0623]|uniref:hypothetical protein n=1 Tax=Paenibacillus sp. FSL R5-0623 TaxID=2921651 RepID=UPI0030DAA569